MKNKINIYLNKEDRKKLDAIKVKYQLSLTTIVDILILTTYRAINKTDNNQELLEKFTTEYIYKNGPKTSITTPKRFKTIQWNEKVNKSRFATNVIKVYLYKEIGKFIKDQTIVQEYHNLNNTEMTKTYDEYWHYNESIRYQRRMLKENKDYFRKALEQC